MVNIIFKRNKIKMITALIVIVLLISTTCITSIRNKSPKNFTPRLSAPSFSNCCYYNENIFYNSGFGMPNCTAYAWGRAYEILKEKPNLSTCDAGQWYQYNKENNIYSYGTMPKLGAIACFNNKDGGHVAVVEKIQGDIIIFSNSAYGGDNFYLSYANVNNSNPGQNGWTFQGYIYLGDYKDNTISINTSCKVSSNEGINLRQHPGVESMVLKVIPNNTKIYITDVYSLDGYYWGLTSYNGIKGYCALNYTEAVI